MSSFSRLDIVTRVLAGLILMGVTQVFVGPAGAALFVNEVQPWSGSPGGEGEAQPVMIEFYSTGPGSESLSLHSVAAEGPAGAFAFGFPAWIVPAQCYLTVFLGAGTDDSDFSDSAGTYFAGEIGQLARSAGEIGLYSTGPIQIEDFVNWGTGSSMFGAAYTDAVTAGIWTAGSYVELGSYGAFSHLGRVPSGWDTDAPENWQELVWDIAAALTPHNPIEISPLDGVLLPSVTTLVWKAVPGVSVYTVQVDNDSDFTSLEVSQVVFFTTSTTIGVPDGEYYWRVIPNLSGGPYPAAVWTFGQGIPAALVYGYSAVPQRLQHKDTQLLCIWYLGDTVNKRPGCTELAGAQGPWDAEHSQDSTHIVNCNHCNQYCARASIAMICSKFAGSLTQDEISYNMMQGKVAGPEGDLGHDRPAKHGEGDYGAYSWALMGAATPVTFQAAGDFPWATLMAQIDADRPILAAVNPGHAVVYSGYLEIFGRRYCHITDPWPGKTGWRRLNRVKCYRYYTLPAGAIAGRATDANVAADGDGDGVRNFDEQHPDPASGQVPRPFCSNWQDEDTEDDEVWDKQEIRSYTFHDTDHGGHENDPLLFPDIDGDGLRQECDCDGDNDSDFDGGEDINGDGQNPVGGLETCEYNPADFELWTGVLLIPGPELCTEDAYLFGQTFHNFSWYPYEIIYGCPIPIDSTGLGWSGIVFTVADGIMPLQYIGTYGPGIYRVTVDVLRDQHYNFPDNWDPWLCFLVPPHCYLVIDVPTTTYSTPFYTVALDALSLQYVIYEVPPGADGPTTADMASYDVVIWVTGDSPSATITTNDAMNLMGYLDQGGKLMLTGQDIGTEIFMNPDSARQQFYNGYLGAQYVQEAPQCTMIDGNPGQFLAGLQGVPTYGPGGANYPQHTPDDVFPSSPSAFMAGRWSPNNCFTSAGGAVIGNENPSMNSRTAYYTFPWENITDQALRQTTLDATLDWLYGSTAEPPPAVADLTIRAVGGSAELNWSAVPGAQTYNIHASNEPDFTPDETNFIAATTDVSYMDPIGPTSVKRFYKLISVGQGHGEGAARAQFAELLRGQTDLQAVIGELERRQIKHRVIRSDQ